MRKVKIIGAGVAGMAAGCYLQMNGYDTEIIEQHSISGGLCTGWKRGDYTFDGCIHWLIGSAQGSAFHRIWNELFDLGKVEFVNHDIRVSIETKDFADRHGNKVFHFYSDIDVLEKYMLDIAPEDSDLIRDFIRSIRYIFKFDLPPLIDKSPRLRSFFDKLSLIKLLPLVLFLSKWGKITNTVFADKLRNPFLKEVFNLLFEGKEYSVLAMTMQLVYFSKRCAGFPMGGSLSIAGEIEKRYRSLGGKITFNTHISKIITENQSVTGIQTKEGNFIASDIVISAADWYYTIFEALDGKYCDPTILSLKNQDPLEVFYSVILVSLGISRTFKIEPHLLRFPLEKPFTMADGTECSRMEAHIFNYDTSMAPQGKTVLSVSLPTIQGDFWIDLRKKDIHQYRMLKEEISMKIIDALEARFGDIKAHVEVIDVATPATFFRYTRNWKGSIQGWLPPKKLFAPSPVKSRLPGLKNFYLTGHWMEPGGGIPIAALSARNIAQEICALDKKVFTIKK